MIYRPIDFSRYRVAEAIVEQFRAGDDPASIAENYGLDADSVGRLVLYRENHGAWVVELLVAAHDRRGNHYPRGGDVTNKPEPSESRRGGQPIGGA